jgi:hypothetical protein
LPTIAWYNSPLQIKIAVWHIKKKMNFLALVWQPTKDYNGRLADFKLKSKLAKRLLQSAGGCHTCTVTEFIAPVFAKRIPKRSFSILENECFGLVFAKLGL